MSLFYEKTQRYDSAFWCQKFSAQISDSLRNADISKQLQELEVLPKLQEKEQQITILTQNAEINRHRQYVLLAFGTSLLVLISSGGWLMWQRRRHKQRRITEE